MTDYGPPPSNSSNYPPPPPPQLDPQLQNEPPQNGDRGENVELQSGHHGLPQTPQAYQQYEPRGIAQLQQQVAYAHAYADSPADGGNGVPIQQQAARPVATPQRRLRKACDLCSQRKVKCDENDPCQACNNLNVPCTRNRQSKRRGPTNKAAEIFKRQQLGPPGDGFTSADDNTLAASALASLQGGGILTLGSFHTDIQTLDHLVNDFFTYIHPLCPFPHEPTFREAFHRGNHSPGFIALFAAMIGALVASFPRSPRLHLNPQDSRFPNAMQFIDHCHSIVASARGTGYLDRDPDVDTVATSYFLGLAGAYTFQWNKARLYFAETVSLSRVLGLHKPSFNGGVPGMLSNYVIQEIGRRLFWVMLVTIRSMEQYGAVYGELFFPLETNAEPYPPLPMELDDNLIFPDHVDPQPLGIVSQLTGYNRNLKIYLTVTPLVKMELALEYFEWDKQKAILEECLMKIKKVLDDVPRELRLDTNTGLASPDPSYASIPDYPDHTNGSQWQPNMGIDHRRVQYEIQKANIYASQLSVRSYIVEKYWTLLELHTPNVGGVETDQIAEIETILVEERENVVKELLQVLDGIHQVHVEPNGASLLNKLRQIAGPLTESPASRKGPFALKHDEYLSRLVIFLVKLEKTGRSVSGDGFDTEEELLREWASLKQNQERFLQAGGFLG